MSRLSCERGAFTGSSRQIVGCRAGHKKPKTETEAEKTETENRTDRIVKDRINFGLQN